MKIQLNQTWQDGATVFPRFAVLEMSESEALALIAEGYGHRVADDTRLFVSETLITACVTPTAPLSGEIESTGETTDLGGLIQGKTYSADEVKEAEKRRGNPFGVAGLSKK